MQEEKRKLPAWIEPVLTEEGTRGFDVYENLHGDRLPATVIEGMQPLPDGRLRLFLNGHEPVEVNKGWVEHWGPAIGSYVMRWPSPGHTSCCAPVDLSLAYTKVSR